MEIELTELHLSFLGASKEASRAVAHMASILLQVPESTAKELVTLARHPCDTPGCRCHLVSSEVNKAVLACLPIMELIHREEKNSKN